MRKLKVSFTGNGRQETWHIDAMDTVAEPHLTISRHSRSLQVVFETTREHERFYEGVAMCRAKYMEDGFVREIYLSAFVTSKP